MLEQIKSKFGIKSFKDGQEGAIAAAMEQRDVLCFMPTGYGKSICYQIPAIMSKGLTLVITPLISLMNDQVRELDKIGFPSVAIHAESSRDHVYSMLSKPSTKLIYLSPERLLQKDFVQFISQRKIERVVVDEAHCISMWGDGFRPEYQQIGQFIAHLEGVFRSVIPVSAFTGTANHRVVQDIIKYSRIRSKSAYYFKGDIIRKNVFIEMKRSKNKKDDLIKYLHSNRFEPTVVYVSTIKDAELTSELLSSNGISHKLFHSKLSPHQKSDSLLSFMNNYTDLIVATSAFGMGINKPNIRHIVHIQMPESVEMYYQQVGRSGRDGYSSKAVMFFDNKDKSLNRFMTQLSYPKPDNVWSVICALNILSEDGLIDIGEDSILEKCPLRMSSHELRGVIRLLDFKGILVDWSDKDDNYYRLEFTGLGNKIDMDEIESRRRRSFDDFDAIFNIAESSLCRAFLIEDYFSSRVIAYNQCGSCDNCIKEISHQDSPCVNLEDLLAIKKDVSLIPLFDRYEMIMHWLGYREIKSGSKTLSLTKSRGYKYSVFLFDLLITMGFFVEVNDRYLVNSYAFKNKSLVKVASKASIPSNGDNDVTRTIRYSRLNDFRYKEAFENKCSPNAVLTHKQMVELCTLEKLSKSSLEKIVGNSLGCALEKLLIEQEEIS